MTKNDLLPLATYFVAITGGYLWGMLVGPTLSLDANISSILGMSIGGLIAYSYLKRK